MSAPSSPEAPWPVRTVARKVADWIGRLGEVWVEGQVAQLSRRGNAATVFLTLRDPVADLSVPVTCHRDIADRPGLELTEGSRVIVRARPDYYVARGSFSLRATEIRAVGLGELLARIERIRQLLAAEGLFDAVRKRPLPFAPAVVGVITGRDSAAERDVLVTARRRWPAVRFAMHNCAVQGPQAAANVIDGLRRLDADATVEVIVVARGGGSVEDLLPFSDEGLVRAIAACRTPVVTAVGHETDTTLVDHVADVRAATPTDAAHRIVPEIGEQRRLVEGLRNRARHLVTARLEQQERWLESVRTRPVLASPDRLLHGRADDFAQLRTRSRRTVVHRVEGAERDLEHARARVTALSPAATLERGYAVVQRADGALVRDPAEVGDGERLRVRVSGGRLAVVVDREDGEP
ncbi:exodeoxyribonuclease VII large subunit [Blastococcus goldschmidtiae]|uniref:Exodeoxyribonuclease 7 large subunit n=1 Tax=Blastococcus goldschmidtiae TaxID=3075546 RepID=A0ABU2KDY0_9ACTN|nr:exodeoxyribonuclease VII large subunit [Blastococcus sp. DSM 46792]MDT0278389.1 exodeoxyribonuclease VII large subunit [Blastococcus sp. DSM 46792]